jgi:hypothetical protein
MAWIDNISGDFITSTTKVGVLKVWNAAQTSPKDMIKVVPHGIVCIQTVSERDSTFLLQLRNG